MNTCRETDVSPTRCVLTAHGAAEHGRPKVPIRKLSPSQSIKSQVHAPTFYEPASQVLLNARCRAGDERERSDIYCYIRKPLYWKVTYA